MNPIFSNKKLIGWVIGIIVAVALIMYSLTYGSNIVTQGVNDVTNILGRLVSYPANSINDFIDSVNDLSNTYQENQSLKQKINTIHELEVQLSELKRDNQKMKETLKLQDTLNDYTLVNATVIARNPDTWRDVITINKGANDGIQPQMSVMSDNGLVGKVLDVNPTSARIALLSNADNTLVRVAAMIQNEKEPIYGTITGYDEKSNMLVMSQIQATQDIKVGDKVVTSGLGGISPNSLYIGTVEEVAMDRFGLYKEVKIRPAADTNDVRYVTVVIRTSESEGQ
ncbi:rod shape-determining protein MreC [uncultured Granulicatella sp.]|uniref:rod shape-determining protein MreC n=1 Tax=uncultured Granulicatella sp. TaxID=316089 RepID=UPI0026029FB2|nr:rod shape-determining protein MreC [uncultured Granulicatella sp.]